MLQKFHNLAIWSGMLAWYHRGNINICSWYQPRSSVTLLNILNASHVRIQRVGTGGPEPTPLKNHKKMLGF